MIPRGILLLGLIAVAAPCLAERFGESAAAPVIPPEIAPHIPKNVKPYFVVFLVNSATPKPMPHELFIRHQAYIRRQVEAGTFHLVGPLTDGGRLRGMKIVTAASAEQARALAAGDPAVQEGIFAVEVHPAMFPDLESLKIEYPPKQQGDVSR